MLFSVVFVDLDGSNRLILKIENNNIVCNLYLFGIQFVEQAVGIYLLNLVVFAPLVTMPGNPDAEKNNPCLKEQDLVHKCLNKNNYDNSQCELYFTNYNNCKDFWYRVRRDRRAQGKYPYLPDIEDRAKIKEEYMRTKPSG